MNQAEDLLDQVSEETQQNMSLQDFGVDVSFFRAVKDRMKIEIAEKRRDSTILQLLIRALTNIIILSQDQATLVG